MPTETANKEQAEYWSGDESVHWLEYEGRYETMLAAFNEDLLREGAIEPSDRVLDVGCGCGSSTRAVGHRAAGGHALGIDLSLQLLRRAEERTLEEGLSNVSFEHADMQVHRLDHSAFDVAISRFGVMFFADPRVAFANITCALRPGGRLVVICWADALDNEWVVVPGGAAAQCMSLPAPADTTMPGPFSLADASRISQILEGSGLVAPTIEAVNRPLLLGSDVADTVKFFKATGFGQRLLDGVDPGTVARVTDAMSTALEPFQSVDGIRLDSKAWLVTARRPG